MKHGYLKIKSDASAGARFQAQPQGSESLCPQGNESLCHIEQRRRTSCATLRNCYRWREALPYLQMIEGRLLVAYHGCDITTRDDLVTGKLADLDHSKNPYDWLAPVYISLKEMPSEH